MKYIEYTLKSLNVFILCFLLGTFIDEQFHKYQESVKNISSLQKLLIGLFQLVTIITVTYILHTIKFFHNFFEEYSPNVLFSTFLLSLQSNMISNFKYILKYEYFN
jgi:hypothetical protein